MLISRADRESPFLHKTTSLRLFTGLVTSESDRQTQNSSKIHEPIAAQKKNDINNDHHIIPKFINDSKEKRSVHVAKRDYILLKNHFFKFVFVLTINSA